MQNITIYDNPSRELWDALVKRNTPQDDEIAQRVAQIIDGVAAGGDKALREIVESIEGSAPESFEVSAEQFAAAEESVSEELKTALQRAKANIESFHAAQRHPQVDVEVMPGIRCVQRSVAINRVGLYVPGGSAPLVSTVLMLSVPASIAGCREVVLCTPASRAGEIAAEILYAAKLCGVHRVFALGGAQAIAAMACGTESVPRVDKIFGPGNRYVTKAKQIVSTNRVAIDMPAGPSEVLVLADDTASVDFVASDLLSQAEHGADSQAMLVCMSMEFAQGVIDAVAAQCKLLKRSESIERSLSQSRIVVLADREAVVEFSELYGPEHLIISMDDAWGVANQITTAGSIFVGRYSPVSAGDYASGTNHTLPTDGWGRSYSGVGLDSFMRKQTYQELAPEGILALAPTVIAMANAEGLDAHARSVQIRVDELKG